MRLVRVPLTEQEEAHVALILEVHRQTMAEIERLHRQAEETKAARFVPISRAKGVPDGVLVNVVARANGEPAYLTYEGPDIAPEVITSERITGYLAKRLPLDAAGSPCTWERIPGRDAIRLRYNGNDTDVVFDDEDRDWLTVRVKLNGACDWLAVMPPESPAGPVADGLGQVSEKSTSAPAQES